MGRLQSHEIFVSIWAISSKGNKLDTESLIYSDSRELGQWFDLELPESKTLRNLEKLFALYGGAWTIRSFSGSVQVRCLYEQNPDSVRLEIKQFLADTNLRERISKRCIIQANTLVNDVLCHLMKNPI